MHTVGGRIQPVAGPGAYKSYQVVAPLATHWRSATCAEVACPDYVNGWQTIVPADSPAADYIRGDRSRRHVEERLPGGVASFTFEPGQQGFAPAHNHKVRVERPERFIIRGGDHRGNPHGDRAEVPATSWTDDFGEHQEKLAEQLERG